MLLRRLYIFITIVIGICIGAVPVYASTINSPTDFLALNAGLVGWWTMDGQTISGTTITDQSGNGNSGTLINSPKPIAGKLGQALWFNGSNSQINLPSTLATSVFSGGHAFTVSVWVYPTVVKSDESIFSVGSTGTDSLLHLVIRSGIPRLAFYADDLIAGSSVPINTWLFFTFVYTGSTDNTRYIYMNGVQIATDHPIGILNTTGTPAIGRYAGSVMQGNIDDFHVYNRALSASEIQQLYGMSNQSHINTTSVGPANLNNGLVSWWTFDGKTVSGTTVTDMSGNGNTGTFVNNPTVGAGVIGQAMQFNGVGQSILSNPTTNLPAINGVKTMSAWVYPRSVGTGDIVDLLASLSGTSADQLRISGGKLLVSQWGGANTIVSTATLSPNRWYFVTYTYDGTTNKLYINGSLDTSNTVTSQSNTTAVLRVGTYGSGEWINGFVDDVRVYNRALSATEVGQLYNLGSSARINTSVAGAESSSLLGWWTFDGKTVSGTTVTDMSGNGNNGTIVNTVTPVPGVVGQAFNFNGTNQYVGTTQLSGASSLSAATISAWVYSNSGQSAYAGLVESRVSLFTALGVNNGTASQVWFDWNGTMYSHNSGYILPTKKWVFLTITFDTNTGSVSLYANGSLVYTESDSMTPKNLNGIWNIGRDPSYSSGRNFNGSIDDVRIYNKALSTAEIQQLYNAGK